ncbi:hypothetical protein HDU96_010932, partial [Phlyctochytrium bullatum]
MPVNSKPITSPGSARPLALNFPPILPLFIGASLLAGSLLPRPLGVVLGLVAALVPLGKAVLERSGVLANPRMERVIKGRVSAKIEGDFVVFLIGSRPNAGLPGPDTQMTLEAFIAM